MEQPLSAEERRRRRRILQRKKKMRNRRIATIFVLAVICIIALRWGIQKIASGPSYHAGDGGWISYLMDRKYEEITGEPVVYIDEDMDVKLLAMKGFEIFGSPLVKGQNHIRSAAKYAYDTAMVRRVIEGKENYTGPKVAFLTFDDGPTEITPKLLDQLKREGVPATFFILGRGITDATEPYLIRELYSGHGIAMHSMTHDYKRMYPGRVGNVNRIGYEAQEQQKVLREVLGNDFSSGVWRYPGGHMSWKGLGDGPDQAVKDAGAEWIDWNAMTGDAQPARERPTTPEGQVAYLDMTLKKANHPEMAVILMHDAVTKDLTVESIPAIVAYLRSEGYTFGILK